MACLAPADVLEWHLVSRLIDEAWFIKRYARHQTVAVERRYQQSLEFQAQRVKTQNARKETLANSLAERMTRRPPEVADLLHLEEKVLETPAEFDEILQRTPTELQHNRALEKSIIFQEQLDKLVASAPLLPPGAAAYLAFPCSVRTIQAYTLNQLVVLRAEVSFCFSSAEARN